MSTTHQSIADLIDRLCNGLENYRDTAPWGDDDEEMLVEARQVVEDLQEEPEQAPASSRSRTQHDADSQELRSLCTQRDEARRERDKLRAQVEALSKPQESRPCSYCNGTGVDGDASDDGRTVDIPCGECDGTGRSTPQPLTRPASDIATQIIRGVCETDPADPELKDTLCISVADLKGIVDAALADQPLTRPAVPEGFLREWAKLETTQNWHTYDPDTLDCNACGASTRNLNEKDFVHEPWCPAEFARAALAAAPQPEDQHPDDLAIDRFATALKTKMAESRAKGRQGWDSCPPAKLSTMLRHHVEKGDPRDVALFCMMLWHQAAPIESPASSQRVYLVATGETCNGMETYTRHEALVPMADQEVLWSAEPMAQLFANFAAADLTTWSRTMLEQFVGRVHEELVKLFAWTTELYEAPLNDDTMRAIRTRALDEFGVGQAQGEVWDQILMRETARTIQAAAKGGA
jgi:hypothetical protein